MNIEEQILYYVFFYNHILIVVLLYVYALSFLQIVLIFHSYLFSFVSEKKKKNYFCFHLSILSSILEEIKKVILFCLT